MKLDTIPIQVQLDKVPSEFDGTVTEIKVGKSQSGNPKLAVSVNATWVENNKPISAGLTLGYKIPKALTGKGQFDKLIIHLKKLGISDTDDMKGRTFHFTRENLDGTMQGNPRHYPVNEIKPKK